jgi:isopentenyl diphosphate isomerase/L-lactate dehydrogenase-like FMN-dependent dehydrogenase
MAHDLEQAPAAYSEFQNEIYTGRQPPPFPVQWRELERAAYEAMTPEAAGYVAGGAGGEDTVRANRDAFDRLRIVPRMLRGVGTRDLSTSLLGTRLPAPVLLGPVGVQQIIHRDAEVATARAAAGVGVPYVHSTAASTSIEDAAAANGDGPRWFQLYFPTDREVAASFVERAERAGYAAVVVTLDTLMLGWRPRDLARAYLPFLDGIGLANYTSDPVFRSRLAGDTLETTVEAWISIFANPDLSWADIAWLRERTELPLLVKGVLSAEDARRALDAGVRGLVVSNHGGRQVDGAIAALDALPGVVGAVPPEVPVLFDSGIRTGADAVKALALGARAVLIARPAMWGLALGGEAGVRHVLRTFLGELENTLAMAGYRSHRELAPGSLQARP